MVRSLDQAGIVPGKDGPGAAHLYVADCPSLRAWSRTVGFRALHVSVAPDPASRIAALRRSAHAQSTYAGHVGFRADAGAWRLAPLGCPVAGRTLPAGCSRAGDTIRVELPEGTSSSDLSARLAVFLEPLDAIVCSQLPSAVVTRALQDRMLPVMPRYSSPDGAPRLVRDLYRIEGEDDAAYVLEALGAALTALGHDREAFDRVLATLGRCPRADERVWAPVEGIAA